MMQKNTKSLYEFVYFVLATTLAGTIISFLQLAHALIEDIFQTATSVPKITSLFWDPKLFVSIFIVCAPIAVVTFFISSKNNLTVSKLKELKIGNTLFTLSLVLSFFILLIKLITLVGSVLNNTVTPLQIGHFIVDLIVLGGLLIFLIKVTKD